MSDNPDGRAILASLPAHATPAFDVDVPLAVIPCLRLDGFRFAESGGWIA